MEIRKKIANRWESPEALPKKDRYKVSPRSTKIAVHIDSPTVLKGMNKSFVREEENDADRVDLAQIVKKVEV